VADGSAPFVTDRNTLLLLRSLAGQVGTTLEVQGRWLNAVSLGAGRNIYSFPPAPMSSYLLDTTSNASVTYGQGKYVASASTEQTSGGVAQAWKAFDKNTGTSWNSTDSTVYNNSSPYNYTGSVRTVDILGNSYAGEWLQIQLPVSVLISSYSITPVTNPYTPSSWFIIGSRDGINWTLVDQRIGVIWVNNTAQTFSVGATQAYTYYRIVNNQVTGNTGIYGANIVEWTLNGTEESLCITSDSKVGVGIANPQRALEVAGDLVVSGTISGGAGLGSFRNRIINGDMRIAQRGTSNVLASDNGYNSAYLIDRWNIGYRIATGTITQFQSALAASDAPYQLGLRNYMNVYVNSACTSFTYIQPSCAFEGYSIQDLNWGTSFGIPVTLSFWYRTNAPSGSTTHISLRNYNISTSYIAPFTIANSGVWQYVILNIPPPPNGTAFNTGSSGALELSVSPAGLQASQVGWFTGTSLGYTGSYNWPTLAGNYIHFTGVQLEKGTVATPWEQRPYATELALCQRYYQQFGGNAFTRFAAGGAYSTVGAHLALPALVTMRANPTTISNSAVTYFYLEYGASSITPTSLSCSSAAPNNISVDVGVASGLTAGGAVVLIANNTTAAFLGFSAEL
jgi:hypothetical protein